MYRHTRVREGRSVPLYLTLAFQLEAIHVCTSCLVELRDLALLATRVGDGVLILNLVVIGVVSLAFKLDLLLVTRPVANLAPDSLLIALCLSCFVSDRIF